VNKLEREFREVKHLSSLTRVKSLGLSVVGKVLVVTKDKGREKRSLEIVLIFL